MCGYFIFQDYSDHYRFFAKFVFVPELLIFVGAIRDTWRQPVFQAMAVYLLYLLLSGLWSDPLDWYRLGQKFTVSIYLLSFIAITHFLVQWNRGLYERMLQLCVLIGAVAALTNLLLFYREHAFPGTRVDGIGSLTNINEFAVVYGVFALLAIGFASWFPSGSRKWSGERGSWYWCHHQHDCLLVALRKNRAKRHAPGIYQHTNDYGPGCAFQPLRWQPGRLHSISNTRLAASNAVLPLVS
jgi:hypothetical protein